MNGNRMWCAVHVIHLSTWISTMLPAMQLLSIRLRRRAYLTWKQVHCNNTTRAYNSSITYDIRLVVLGREPRVISEFAQLVFGAEQVLWKATDDGHEVWSGPAVRLGECREPDGCTPDQSGSCPANRLHGQNSMPHKHTHAQHLMISENYSLCLFCFSLHHHNHS